MLAFQDILGLKNPFLVTLINAFNNKSCLARKHPHFSY